MNTEKDFGIFSHETRKKKKKNRLKIIFLLFVILSIGFTLFLYIHSKTNIVSDEILSDKEVDKLIQDVSQIMLLPNEEPAVFVVSDIEQLVEQQQFFKDAINGDVLFIFPQAVRAVIYSPSRNIIVNTGPITSNNNQISNYQTNQNITESNQIIDPVFDESMQ